VTPVTGRRQLIVMRHAKAEPFASTDHARTLTDRGHADAAAAGTWLSALGLMPDHAAVSTAVRARETWFDVARACGAELEPAFDDGLYHGGVDAALESLQSVPADVRTVILVGHNPTAAYLAHLLDDGEGDDEAISGMLRGFPPGAAVVFDVQVGWSDLAAEAGRVTGFHST
jgi:phosphohistidine phosphatase